MRSLGRDRLTVNASQVLAGTRLGDSIAVEGVCLTVVEKGEGWFVVGLMPETLRRSTLGSLRPGQPLNLERALGLGDRLGGHLVQGHVDGRGQVVNRRSEGGALLVRIAAPADLMRYVVEKGFIAVDGASLTVAELDARSFTVSLVPFTQEHITLAGKAPGDEVNLEVDILAKYVERLVGAPRSEMTAEFLAEHGFLG
ncbi:MAG: riboflavin synthase [Bacteroidetes bacterium]|nr:riboflavin synthase [Bacteroidota bacterium]